jgi:predicted dehydrogenase
MLNTVVVGFGFMGRTHTSNILKNPSVQLRAIVDKNPDNIQVGLNSESGNFSTEAIDAGVFSGMRTYDNMASCLKVEKPDVCVIAVHTNLHFELAKMALEEGIHVFLEKPFCLDVNQGLELIELSRKNNKILMVGHVVRFMPAYQKLKQWLDSKEFGDIKFLSLSRFSGIPSWGQWKERQKEFGSSGGALFDLVIHDIDFVQWVCGTPENINAHCLPGKLSNYDYVTAHWKYKNSDCDVKIEGGNTFHTNYPFHASFVARFQNASVYYSSNAPESIMVANDYGTTLIPAGDANDGFSNEFNYFVNCIINNEQPEKCTPESALETIKICYRHIS